jgi:hypothetical protein
MPVRPAGAVLGLLIGLAFAALGAFVLFPQSAVVGQVTTGAGGVVSTQERTIVEPDWSLAPVILLAGSVGGFLLAPMAWRARSRGEWLATILALGLAAVAIGDLIVVLTIMASQPIDTIRAGDVVAPLWIAGGVVELFLFGLVIAGWIAAPFALAAAAIWAFGMSRLRRRRVA